MVHFPAQSFTLLMEFTRWRQHVRGKSGSDETGTSAGPCLRRCDCLSRHADVPYCAGGRQRGRARKARLSPRRPRLVVVPRPALERAAHLHAVAAQVGIVSNIGKQIFIFEFQALRFRGFHREFRGVNLHRPTTHSLSIASTAVLVSLRRVCFSASSQNARVRSVRLAGCDLDDPAAALQALNRACAAALLSCASRNPSSSEGHCHRGVIENEHADRNRNMTYLRVCEGVCVFKSSLGLIDQISQNHLGYQSTLG